MNPFVKYIGLTLQAQQAVQQYKELNVNKIPIVIGADMFGNNIYGFRYIISNCQPYNIPIVVYAEETIQLKKTKITTDYQNPNTDGDLDNITFIFSYLCYYRHIVDKNIIAVIGKRFLWKYNRKLDGVNSIDMYLGQYKI